jgi:DNA-binding XRE family transcriptional regulator
MTGITVQTLSNIVNNKYNTSLEVALKLSYILDVTFDILFYLEKEK